MNPGWRLRFSPRPLSLALLIVLVGITAYTLSVPTWTFILIAALALFAALSLQVAAVFWFARSQRVFQKTAEQKVVTIPIVSQAQSNAIRVFVSGPYLETKRVKQAVESLKVVEASTMEDATTSGKTLKEYLRAEIEAADVVVFVVGKEHNRAVAEEFEIAHQEKKPIIVFVSYHANFRATPLLPPPFEANDATWVTYQTSDDLRQKAQSTLRRLIIKGLREHSLNASKTAEV